MTEGNADRGTLQPTVSARRLRRVYVEISNVCNLKCDFCPTVERQSQIMDEGTFRRVIQEVAPLADEVCLHLMGEPLGHALLPKFIGICGEFSLPVNLTTNGLLLTGPRRDALLGHAVRQVNFSLQSFAANFPDADPAVYLRRIFDFVREAQVVRPDLYINLRLWDLAEPLGATQHNQVVREALSAEFGCGELWSMIDVRRKKRVRLSGRVYLAFDTRFEWPSMTSAVQGDRGFCHGLGTHVGIHADGTVVPCCLDKEAVIALGNAREESLRSIIESPRASAMRDGFARGELVEDLCKRCTFIDRFARKPVVTRSLSGRPEAASRSEALLR